MKPRAQYKETPHVYVRKLGICTLYYPADTPTIVHFVPTPSGNLSPPVSSGSAMRCSRSWRNARFKILTAALLKIQVLWDVTSGE